MLIKEQADFGFMYSLLEEPGIKIHEHAIKRYKQRVENGLTLEECVATIVKKYQEGRKEKGKDRKKRDFIEKATLSYFTDEQYIVAYKKRDYLLIATIAKNTVLLEPITGKPKIALKKEENDKKNKSPYRRNDIDRYLQRIWEN
ncbi:hypothetical protein [Brevibacillus halotolerans]|uniref:hypothetical protein n=1 Tax=Brevibacillus halotolerans TaxID=1507437 RepID=UPI0015EFA19B|nr:hypothetical protein [Brevibacillus halotolerans]MBA4533814.1 hypothetical protein [Brevibacillus halotolerans]